MRTRMKDMKEAAALVCGHIYSMRTRMKEAAALETEAYLADRHELAGNRFERQHTSAYVSIRQHTSAYVSILQHTRTWRIGMNLPEIALSASCAAMLTSTDIIQVSVFVLLYW